MSWTEIKGYNETHDKLVQEARSMVESAGREGRTLNEEERNVFNAKLSDADKAADDRKKLEDSESRQTFALPKVEDRKDARKRAINNFFKYGADTELRAMTSGNDSLGGAFIDQEMSDQFFTVARPASAIRQIATVFNTPDGGPMDMPKLDDTANTAALYTENNTVTVTDIATSRTTFHSYELATAAALPFKLIRDSQFPVEQWVFPALAARYTDKEDYYATLGSGSSQPQGYITGGTKAADAAGVSGITFTDVMNTLAMMPGAYDVDGELTLSCRRATKYKLFSLTDDNHRPLWQLGDFNGKLRPLINGIPIIENANIAAIGASAKSLALVNRRAVMLRDVGSGQFYVDVRPASLTNTYVFVHDIDVLVTYSAACLYLQHPAS